MSELLDELARTLARPMPRRRALGVVGVTLVGLATGGAAGAARRPLVGTQASGCGKGYKVCSTGSDLCRATCCPVHTTCSIGPKSPRGCAISDGCCDPCNREKSQPDGKGGCRPGPIPDHCPCNPGQKKCGDACCEADEYCASSGKVEGSGSSGLLRTCCKRGQDFCMRGRPPRPFCCPRGTRCCFGVQGGFVAAVCCFKGTQICDKGICRCKAGHTVACGKDCCHPARHKCCGTVHKRCVPKDVDCDDAFPNS